MNYWIITVVNPWCSSILLGLKTMEIRKNVPANLNVGDIIFIVRKGEMGHIVGACRVTSLLRESVSYFCNYRREEHRLSATALKEYAGNARFLVGIGLKRLRLDTWNFYVQSLGFERAPQWFYRVRPEYKSTIERVLG